MTKMAMTAWLGIVAAPIANSGAPTTTFSMTGGVVPAGPTSVLLLATFLASKAMGNFHVGTRCLFAATFCGESTSIPLFGSITTMGLFLTNTFLPGTPGIPFSVD